MTSAIECVGISKGFPGVRALDDVSLAVRPGTVHALLGENGAGKSTLIRVLTGAERPDSGTVTIGGTVLSQHTPGAARRLGVRVLPQERHIAPDLSVGHNVFLDALPRTRWGSVSARQVQQRAQAHLDRLGLDLDARTRAGDLTAAQQQLVELARTTARPAAVVVLDEPTASLAGDEVAVLFRVVRQLRDRGTALLYISHHLHEVFELADTASVMRNGRLVHQTAVSDTDHDSLLREVFDRDVAHVRLPRPVRPPDAPVVLTGRGVTLPGGAWPLDVEVRAGEVLALSGPAGAGASALAELLAGVRHPTSGTVALGGVPLGARPAAARAGIGFVPADRKREGLLLERAITENLLLGAAARGAWHRPVASRRTAWAALQTGQVKADDPGRPVRTLSGGNQQRVVLARWLLADCKVLVLDQPTAGVDVGAKFDIYAQLLALAAAGVAVVVVSSDYEEICALADRVLVLRDGVVVAEVAGADATPDGLFALESARESTSASTPTSPAPPSREDAA